MCRNSCLQDGRFFNTLEVSHQNLPHVKSQQSRKGLPSAAGSHGWEGSQPWPCQLAMLSCYSQGLSNIIGVIWRIYKVIYRDEHRDIQLYKLYIGDYKWHHSFKSRQLVQQFHKSAICSYHLCFARMPDTDPLLLALESDATCTGWRKGWAEVH